MKAQIPWLRVFVEGVVIVGSILLAFGIQAWWDGRGEREEEQRLLVALLEESRDALQQIDRNVAFHEALIASANALLTAPLSPTATFSADSLDRLIGDLTWKRSVDFETSTLNTILFGGRLAVIDSAELRERITEWQGALDEIADVAAHDWDLAAEELRGYVREHANLTQLSNVMQRVPGLRDPLDITPVPLPTGRQDHFELLRLTEFRTVVLERRWAQEDLLHPVEGYPNLRSALLRLIESLEQEIEEPRVNSAPDG